VANDGFGFAVAVSGTTVVVGVPLAASVAGRAYVFMKTASGWRQAVELKGSDTVGIDRFGGQVAISGSPRSRQQAGSISSRTDIPRQRVGRRRRRHLSSVWRPDYPLGLGLSSYDRSER